VRCCLVAVSEIITGVAVDTRVPVLWICGPAGVGKSTVSWQRIMSRGAGGSWPEPGDRLRGRSAGFLTHAADQAVQAAEALDRSDTERLTVDTTSLSPDESASMIGDAIGWP
jgi:hypothetical protein